MSTINNIKAEVLVLSQSCKDLESWGMLKSFTYHLIFRGKNVKFQTVNELDL